MRTGRTILLLLAATLVAGQASAELSASLSKAVRDARIASPAPALGAVVASCTRVDVSQDGNARADIPSPLAQQARFNIGSNAKAMLATLAATFVRDGLLRWDTQVQEVFAAEAPTLNPVLRRASLAQLLSHHSGTPAFDSGAQLSTVHAAGDTASEQRLDFSLQVLRAPPAYEPGSKFIYSNAGYVIAGTMLERIGGKPFEALLRERVFQPLRMTHATFGDPSTREPGQPFGHITRDGAQAVYLDADPAIPAFLTPAGNVSLTLEDYGRFLQEHLCGLQRKPTRVLSADLIHFLHKPQGDDGASLGWGAYVFSGVPADIHTGGTRAFSAFVAILPTRDVAVATVTNSGFAASREAALTLLQSLIGAVLDRTDGGDGR